MHLDAEYLVAWPFFLKGPAGQKALGEGLCSSDLLFTLLSQQRFVINYALLDFGCCYCLLRYLMALYLGPQCLEIIVIIVVCPIAERNCPMLRRESLCAAKEMSLGKLQSWPLLTPLCACRLFNLKSTVRGHPRLLSWLTKQCKMILAWCATWHFVLQGSLFSSPQKSRFISLEGLSFLRCRLQVF